jgi:hypothetical protein
MSEEINEIKIIERYFYRAARCESCGDEAYERDYPNGDFAQALLRNGWRIIDGELYCDWCSTDEEDDEDE